MIFDDNHIPDFEGAQGTCEVCGLEITLDWQDRPKKPLDNTWTVNCPHCGNSVCCYQSAQHSVQLTSGGRGKNKGRVASATRN